MNHIHNERGKKMRIGIIGAMEEEVDILRHQLNGMETKAIAGCEFYHGTLHDVDVVLVKSGIGKVNAAIATTLLNELYTPTYVINTGSAGGFHHELAVGDIVVSSEVRYHDVDATVFGYEYGQVPQMPANYVPDEQLVEVAIKSAEKIDDIHVTKGLITTSDSFMDSADRVQFVKEKFPSIYAAEMEAGAIAQTCYRFNIPFVVIRALSDIAGKDNDTHQTYEQFLEKAGRHSATLVINMIEELKQRGK